MKTPKLNYKHNVTEASIVFSKSVYKEKQI
jgi:hypothetical protein